MVFYEATLKKGALTEILTKKSLDQLNSAVEIWLSDGTWEIVKAEKVERFISRLS